MTITTELTTTYEALRKYSVDLCSSLEHEDYNLQADYFASPPKWHLAHTTWFFEEFILTKFKEGYSRFHSDFSFLFNSYYNGVGERVARDKRGLLSRPSLEKVLEYRKYVDQNLIELIDQKEGDIAELVTLGLNHEQQHQELLLSDTKYSLSFNPLHPAFKEGYSPEETSTNESGFIAIKEGVYEIGHIGNGFHYDNEGPRHNVYLQDYAISRNLVTNGEYIEFVENGGYAQHTYWLDEAWAWVNENKLDAPLYWKNIDGQWFQFTLGGLRPINPNHELCHISYFEAAAFAEYKGMRLPTEFEWEVACNEFEWGRRWEWTGSSYLPYPGFKAAEGAVGEYNGKFMINQMVLKGASIATSPKHERKTYRNFFPTDARWQFTGIRLAK